MEVFSQVKARPAFYRIAALQFMTFAARGFTSPFVNLYLISIGFTGTQIGLLSSISALVQLILAPVLHMLADRSGRHRVLYYGLITGNISACLGLMAFASSQLSLSGVILLRDSSDTPGAALLSQLTITWLGKGQQTYGKLRAWGSFGWAVTTMISGRLIAIGGYGLLFVLAALLNLAMLPMVRVLPERTAPLRKEAVRHPSPPRGLYILLAGLFFYFVGSGAFSAFIYIYFKQGLGATNEMIGIIASLSALAEVPVMIGIDRLLRRVDIRATLLIGLLGLAALWFMLTQLTGPVLLIPFMMTRGVFYTMQTISTTLLISKISDPANVATNQALAQVTVPGLAILLSGSLNGWLFDRFGGRVLFQLMALLTVISVVVLIIARKQLKGRADDAIPC